MLCFFCNWDPDAKITWMENLILPVAWPSQNELGANTRSGAGWKYRKIRAKFEGCLRKYLKAVPKATGFRRAHLIRAWGPRCRAFDYGNLVGGGKPLIDAMVSLGFLLDDRPDLFQASYHQQPSGTKNHAILIRLEEIVPNEESESP